MQWRLLSIARTAQAFAINGHHALDLSGNALQPGDAYMFEHLRIKDSNYPSKRVV
jgi:hypothetical protein